jgi:hypothetical protein
MGVCVFYICVGLCVCGWARGVHATLTSVLALLLSIVFYLDMLIFVCHKSYVICKVKILKLGKWSPSYPFLCLCFYGSF